VSRRACQGSHALRKLHAEAACEGSLNPNIDQSKFSKCRQRYAQAWAKLQSLSGTQCTGERFEEKSDGTETDNLSGLVWDLSALNTGSFASASGWRVPTALELQTLLLSDAYPCASSPCIDSALGPTQAASYWSSTSGANGTPDAWYVDFDSGCVNCDTKTESFSARAVRGGLF
jgi:hypothetical protein